MTTLPEILGALVSDGRERFSNETGIRDADWERYWVRWSDAVQEAGYAPNQMQGKAYTEGELIEKLITLIRDLGHFPVYRELKMRARNDSTFPADKTFATHFGNKGPLAAKVLEYCTGRAGYEDVAMICAPLAETQPAPPDGEAEPEPDFGFVYLAKSGRYYKVGRSNATGRRERELAIQLPEKLAMVHTIRTDDPAGIEAYWHRRFAPKRKNGEWFDLDALDVKAFRRRKFM